MAETHSYILRGPITQPYSRIGELNPEAEQAIDRLFALSDSQISSGDQSSLPDIHITTEEGLWLARRLNEHDVLVSGEDWENREGADLDFGKVAAGRSLRSGRSTGMGDESPDAPSMVLECCWPDGSLVDPAIGIVGVSMGRMATGWLVVVDDLSIVEGRFNPGDFLGRGGS